MRDRFAALYTAALADVLDDHGLRRQTLPPEIRPLVPGMRVVGQAFTVAGEPSAQADWDATIRKTLAMLGSVPGGHVAVYATGSRPLGALRRALGGLARLARRRRLRDRRRLPRHAVHRRGGLPGLHPLRHARGLDLALGGDRDAGADRDRRRADRARATGWSATRTASSSFRRTSRRAVLEEAERKAATENEIRAAVRAGTSPLEAFERYGTF